MRCALLKKGVYLHCVLMKIWLMAEDKNIRVCQVLHGIVGGGSEQVIPLVSVVVPVYNAARTLKKCVGSLTSQTFGNIEILLVNNGSTDDSLEVCKKIANKDSRIKVIDHYEKGVSTARNRGIDESSGDYIMFVDADDWIDANVCEVFANLNSKYNYDLFCFSALYNKGKKSVKSFLYSENVDLLSPEQKESLQIKVLSPQAPVLDYKVNTRFAGSACGKFYKRETLQKNNLRFATETTISEDCLFNTLALDYFCRIGYTKDSFYYYEQHDDSAQNSYRPNSDKYFGFVIKRIQKWLAESRKDQRFIDAANCLFVHYLFGVMKEDIFHKDSKLSFIKRKKRLKEILSYKVFYYIVNSVNASYFSVSEQIVLYLMKKKCYSLLSLLFWLYCRNVF